MSRENWLFEASWSLDGERVTEALIMRRDPVGSVLETDRSVEFAVLRALEATGGTGATGQMARRRWPLAREAFDRDGARGRHLRLLRSQR